MLVRIGDALVYVGIGSCPIGDAVGAACPGLAELVCHAHAFLLQKYFIYIYTKIQNVMSLTH